jgi:hypothetical protein
MANELLSAALVACQSELSNPTKDAINPHFRSKYVTLAAVVDSIRGVFAKNGLTVVQELTTTTDVTAKPLVMACVTTHIVHVSGEKETFGPFMLPVDMGDTRGNLAQAVCSATTYARRYALMAVAGLAPEDDDGNSAGYDDRPTQQATKKPATPVTERPKSGEVQSAARIEARRLYSGLQKEMQQAVDIQMQKAVHKTLKDADESDMPRLQMLCRAAALTNEQKARLTDLLQTNVLDLIQCGNGDVETINGLIAEAAK